MIQITYNEMGDKQYEEGRVTVLTDNELVEEIGKCCKKFHERPNFIIRGLIG